MRLIGGAAADSRYERDRASIHPGGGKSAAVANVFIPYEDIHMLASRLDDVIDLLDGTSRRFAMLHITEVLPPARQLSDILLRAANEIQAAVKEMRKPIAVHQHVARIKQLEEEGDAVYHEAVGALFAGTPNPLDVIKWKEMYDTLERAIDSCMGVAQVLQSISLKNA